MHVLLGGTLELHIIKHPKLYKTWDAVLADKRAIYLGGHTGWGKTTAVCDWLRTSHPEFVYLTAMDDTFAVQLADTQATWLVLDDLQYVESEALAAQIMHYITKHTDSRFVLIGRGQFPSFLRPFEISAQLECFDAQQLRFDEDMTRELCEALGIADPRVPVWVTRETQGYVVSITLVLNRLQKGGTLNAETIERFHLDTYEYFDVMVYARMTPDQRRLLLKTAPFDSFTEPLAQMLMGEVNAAALLAKIRSVSSFLTFTPPDLYSVQPTFHKYLQYKRRLELPAETVNEVYRTAGVYYETQGDVANALKFYELSGDTDKMAQLLVRHSRLHPGKGHFYDTAPYYRALPKEIVMASPDLMSGMSMLSSLYCKPQESEAWYDALASYAKRLDKHDPEYKQAVSQLRYLEIALPHRGIKNLSPIIREVAKSYATGGLQLQEFSVTSNLPSVMHGGKDFCEWSLHDRQIAALLGKPVEMILGRVGIGFVDICLSESQLEKVPPDRITEVVMLANSGLTAAGLGGTIENEFVAISVLGRAMLLKQNLSAAYVLLDGIEQRAQENKRTALKNNIAAQRVQWKLYEGDLDFAAAWMEDSAPDEGKEFHILDRYLYMTKVLCYIAMGRYADAMLLLGRMNGYFKLYHRTYGQMKAGVLLAIVQYHLGEENWAETLKEALDLCEHFGFCRLAAEMGQLLMPLLQDSAWTQDGVFARRVLRETRQYAVAYPGYGKAPVGALQALTDTEKMVLDLLCKGMSNNEIAEMMGIALRTVKFHTGNLYAKMNVKNRAQAVKMAQNLQE